MKNIIALLSITLLLSSCGGEEDKNNTPHKNEKEVETQTSSTKEIEPKNTIETDSTSKQALDSIIDNLESTPISFTDNPSITQKENQTSSAQTENTATTTITTSLSENNSEAVATPEPPVVAEDAVEKPVTTTATKITHTDWNTLLKKHVSSSGKVNYKGFKADQILFDKYLTELSAQAPANDWTKKEKLAYWINAYNAYTVKLIVDNYPIESITKIDKAWDKQFITIAGKKYSLGQIENDILRKMHEPRMHFAINCASVSCPKILNKAFTADNVSSLLKKVTKSFLGNTSKNQLTGTPIKVSKIFEWYANDFEKGDIVKFINKNRTDQLSGTTAIEYLDYDWNLNE